MSLNAPYVIAKLLEGASLGYSFHLIPDVFTLERDVRRISMPHSPNLPQAQYDLPQTNHSANSNNSTMSTTVDFQKHIAHARYCRYGCHAQIVLQTTAFILRYWGHDTFTTLDRISAACKWGSYAIILYALWKNEKKLRGMLENGGEKDVKMGRLAWEENEERGKGIEDEKVGFRDKKVELPEGKGEREKQKRCTSGPRSEADRSLSKVHGMLALLRDDLASQIVTNHEHDLQIVYADFTRKWIESMDDLNLRGHCGGYGNHYRHEEALDCSWAVNLSKEIKLQTSNYHCRYRANTDMKACYYFQDTDLIVRGVIVDKIDGFSGRRHWDDDSGELVDFLGSESRRTPYGADADYEEAI
ncbi:unnamed protein product [Alternaria alternata]